MNAMTVGEALHRSGVIKERARRDGRSLSSIERNICAAAWDMAIDRGITRERINAGEMEAWRDHDLLMAPTKVVAVFSYYDAPYEEIPARADYLVRESNHPGFPVGGHVSADQLIEAGMKLPKTPSYADWIKKGSKAVRS